MNFLKLLGFVFLAIICCLPATSSANGYSAMENQEIWELRLAAARHASETASKSCAWIPESPTVPADKFRPDPHVSKGMLFRKVMAMLRLDQNARAISVAFHDDEGAARVGDVDAANLPILKEIVLNHGFPTVDEVGEAGANAMLMLLAHADEDPDFQKYTLRKMDDEVAKGKLPAMYPAVLKSIRPNIAGAATPSDNGSSKDEHSDPHPDIRRSGRGCYNHSYTENFNSYIRDRYHGPK